MGFLENLQRRLTTPGAEAYSRERFRTSRPPYLREQPPPGSQTTDVVPPSFYDAAAAARRRRRRALIATLLLGGVLLVAGGTYAGIRWYQEVQTVQKHHIQLALESPERVTSGDDVTIRLGVTNESRVPWENVTVEVQTPRGFALKSSTPAPVSRGSASAAAERSPRGAADDRGETIVWAVGTLPPKAGSDFSVTGRLFGEGGETALFTASVRLTPANRPGGTLEKSTLVSVVLSEIPVDLTIDVPRTAASGTPITVRVVYQNRLPRDLTGARLVVEIPSGFALRSTDPRVSDPEQLAWDLPALPPQGEGSITFRGIIEGTPETTHPFTAQVGSLLPDGRFLVQRTVQRSLVIARIGLTLTQLLNRGQGPLKVTPGQEIEGLVRYRNTGTVGLREVIVRLTFEGIGLDASAVKVTGGFFDGRTKTITWSAASTAQLRALRPGEAGELAFSFRILPPEALPFARDADRNFSLTTKAVGDSPDLLTPPGAPKEVATSEYDILVNTVPSVELHAFYDDGRAGLPKSQGPLPPEVGKETVLTVRVRLHNTSNEIIDATYQTVLPEGVRWGEAEYHTSGNVSFNGRTRDVLWTIPVVPARAGAALPGPEFAFQVAITPSLNQVGSEVALTRGQILEGTDAFTAVRVRAEAEAVTTRLVDPERAEVVR